MKPSDLAAFIAMTSKRRVVVSYEAIGVLNDLVRANPQTAEDRKSVV